MNLILEMICILCLCPAFYLEILSHEMYVVNKKIRVLCVLVILISLFNWVTIA